MRFAKIFFWMSFSVVICGSIAGLFFYANLMPLHVDEAGYWFNFTNKAFANRAVPNPQIPNHTLSIYFAKLSLLWFGYNGIGWRFPVIIFGLLDVGLLFILVRAWTGDIRIAAIASALLILTPWFGHYAHELRGYPPYIFFTITTFLSLHFLLKNGDKFLYWFFLFLSFVGCYYSSLGSVVFIFNFMVVFWALKLIRVTGGGDRLLEFNKISLQNMMFFSIVAASFMLYVMLKIDAHLILKNRIYQTMAGEANPLMVGSDIFSTFLGFNYIDDPQSLLFRYPVFLYVFSLTTCFYGIFTAIKEKMTCAVFFLALYVATVLFPVLMGHMIQTRAVSYLLPFVVFFQALGLVIGLDKFFRRTIPSDKLLVASHIALSCILLTYFAIYSIGKYKNMDAPRGNPYEKARDYLVSRSNANDLIISDLYDTVGGFYFWQMILEKNKNIYNQGMVNSIYYLTDKPKANNVILKDYRDTPKEVFPLSAFEEVAFFENKGARKESIFIYRFKIRNMISYQFDAGFFSQLSYTGDNGACQTNFSQKDGLKIICLESWIACSNNGIALPSETLPAKRYQLVIMSRFSNNGTRSKTFFALANPNENGYIGLNYLNLYMINPVVSTINDLDLFRENISTWDTTIQQISKYQNLYPCFSGKLFDGNTLIKGSRVIDFTID